MSDKNEPKSVHQPKFDDATAMGYLVAGTEPGGLERALIRDEQRGQRSLVESTQLPVKGSPGHPMFRHEDDATWAATGIEFGPADPNKLFRDAVLPEGWKKRTTDHHMWSELVDARGRVRAKIFYKASFYDQDAHIGLVSRFKVRRNLDGVMEARNEHAKVPMRVEVFDADRVVYSTKLELMEPIPTDFSERKAWYDRAEEIEQRHMSEACAWLDPLYPQWHDLSAHWHEDDCPAHSSVEDVA